MNHLKIPRISIIKKLFGEQGVSFAYIFGSRVSGDVIGSSDFDFAVYLGGTSKKGHFQTRLKLMQDLEDILPVKVDMVVLNDTHSTTLRYSIVTEGQLIYEKDEAKRLDFALYTMKEYEDFLPFLQDYNAMYLRTA